LRDAFVREVAAFQAGLARIPAKVDTTLRRWIIQDALALDPRPLVPPEARAHLERGRSARERCSCRDSTLRAVDEFSAALHKAPWWGPPYLQLGEALLRVDRKAEAIVCLEFYLLAEPTAGNRAQVERQLIGLRKSSAAAN
jgi:hypothetical protein